MCSLKAKVGFCGSLDGFQVTMLGMEITRRGFTFVLKCILFTFSFTDGCDCTVLHPSSFMGILNFGEDEGEVIFVDWTLERESREEKRVEPASPSDADKRVTVANAKGVICVTKCNAVQEMDDEVVNVVAEVVEVADLETIILFFSLRRSFYDQI